MIARTLSPLLLLACTSAACGGGTDGPDADLSPDPAWPASTAIPLTRSRLGSLYSAVMTVGSSSFPLVIDTGSSTAGVFSSTCRDCDGGAGLYAPGATAVDLGKRASAEYVDGSRWDGEIYSDKVSLGVGTPAETLDLVAIDSALGFLLDPTTNGILGMGPPAGLLDGTTSYALFADRTPSGQLGFELCSAGGTMWLGAVDPLASAAPPQTTPLLASSDSAPYYRVDMADVAVGTQSLGAGSGGFPGVLVDTGTTAFLLPTGTVAALVSAVNAAPGRAALFGGSMLSPTDDTQCLTHAGVTAATVDAMLPPLILSFGDGHGGVFTVAVPATPSYLGDNGQGSFCRAVEAVSDGGPGPILGVGILRGLVTVIDPRARTVGFAPQVGCAATAGAADARPWGHPRQRLPRPRLR